MTKKLLIYDSSDKTFVGLTWKIGALLARFYFDKIISAESWSDFELKIKSLDSKYDEVQFWGHGSPGFIYINNYSSKKAGWETLRDILNNHAVVWLRVCSFAAGELGKRYMENTSDLLAAKLISNSYSIGQWGCQSGLRAISPGETALWPDLEGFNPNGSYTNSAPWKTNTVSALRLSPPKWVKNGT